MAAYEINIGYDITVDAGADLSSSQFLFLLQAGTVCGAGGKALGVLQNNPKSAQGAGVRVMGVSKVVFGGSVSAGDYVSSDSQGRAVTATPASVSAGTPEPLAGSHVIGIALEAGAVGETHPVALIHAGLTN